MSYTNWLRGQTERLENEIRRHPVFDTDAPATPAQLHELRSKVVLHTYLRQQLLRRAPEATVEIPIDMTSAMPEEIALDERDTQEFVLVRK